MAELDENKNGWVSRDEIERGLRLRPPAQAEAIVRASAAVDAAMQAREARILAVYDRTILQYLSFWPPDLLGLPFGLAGMATSVAFFYAVAVSGAPFVAIFLWPVALLAAGLVVAPFVFGAKAAIEGIDAMQRQAQRAERATVAASAQVAVDASERRLAQAWASYAPDVRSTAPCPPAPKR